MRVYFIFLFFFATLSTSTIARWVLLRISAYSAFYRLYLFWLYSNDLLMLIRSPSQSYAVCLDKSWMSRGFCFICLTFKPLYATHIWVQFWCIPFHIHTYVYKYMCMLKMLSKKILYGCCFFSHQHFAPSPFLIALPVHSIGRPIAIFIFRAIPLLYATQSIQWKSFSLYIHKSFRTEYI